MPPFPADTRAPGQRCACILAGAALPCRHEGARSTLCLYTTGRCRPSLPTRGRPFNTVPVYWPVPPFPADTRAPGHGCACIRLAGAALPCRHEGARSTLCLLYTGRCRPSLPTRGRPVNTVPVYWPVPPFPADTRAPGHGCASCILAGAALPCRHEGARSTLCLYTGRCRPSLPTQGRPVNTVPPVYWPVPPFPADTRTPGHGCACINITRSLLFPEGVTTGCPESSWTGSYFQYFVFQYLRNNRELRGALFIYFSSFRRHTKLLPNASDVT